MSVHCTKSSFLSPPRVFAMLKSSFSFLRPIYSEKRDVAIRHQDVLLTQAHFEAGHMPHVSLLQLLIVFLQDHVSSDVLDVKRSVRDIRQEQVLRRPQRGKLRSESEHLWHVSCPQSSHPWLLELLLRRTDNASSFCTIARPLLHVLAQGICLLRSCPLV